MPVELWCGESRRDRETVEQVPHPRHHVRVDDLRPGLRDDSLFERAARQGDAWGLNNLGGMYEMGWGTTKDVAKARDYYSQAIAKGNKAAVENNRRLATATTQ